MYTFGITILERIGGGERGEGGWGEGRTRLGQLQWTPIRGTKCNGRRAVFPSRKGLASYQPLNLGKLAPEGPSHIAIDKCFGQVA